MQRGILRRLWIFILIGITFGFYKPLAAGAGTQLGDPSWDYIFGRQITFRAELESDMAVAEAYFIFSRPEDIEANRVSAALDEQGSLIYDYDFMRFPLRAFSHLEFWFEVVVDSGEIFRSSTGVFEYEDNRFDWKDMRSGLFHVHWYEGDEAFGQEMLDVADKGLQQARNWLPVAASDLINIYAYASAQEMRSTMLLAGTNWIAGHADPDLSLIVVSLPPGPEQSTEMERQIPHELMHILIYQLLVRTVGQAYDKLPTWLNEGLASINEIYPNPYYYTILSQAVDKDSLLSFSDICRNFPVDASGAYLAYAQAASFSRYLYEQYGAEGMQTLVILYAQSDVLDCQDGTTKSLGVPLSQLERDWRLSILGGAATSSERNSPWPWAAVLGIVLVVPLVVLVVNASRRTRQPQSTANSKKST